MISASDMLEATVIYGVDSHAITRCSTSGHLESVMSGN
jgi:hypothetical protein